MTASSSRWITCIHEAGHAVANWYAGNKIDHAYVLTPLVYASKNRPARSGVVASFAPEIKWPASPSAAALADPEAQGLALRGLMGFAGGAYSEARLGDGRPIELLVNDSRFRSDHDEVHKILSPWAGGGGFGDILFACDWRLTALFNRADIWAATLAVASLLEKWSLADGWEVVEAIDFWADVRTVRRQVEAQWPGGIRPRWLRRTYSTKVKKSSEDPAHSR